MPFLTIAPQLAFRRGAHVVSVVFPKVAFAFSQFSDATGVTLELVPSPLYFSCAREGACMGLHATPFRG
jgi:hypothetical protein